MFLSKTISLLFSSVLGCEKQAEGIFLVPFPLSEMFGDWRHLHLPSMQPHLRILSSLSSEDKCSRFQLFLSSRIMLGKKRRNGFCICNALDLGSCFMSNKTSILLVTSLVAFNFDRPRVFISKMNYGTFIQILGCRFS